MRRNKPFGIYRKSDRNILIPLNIMLFSHYFNKLIVLAQLFALWIFSKWPQNDRIICHVLIAPILFIRQ